MIAMLLLAAAVPAAGALGAAPLCEPSAAVTAPWDRTTVLVSDNGTDGSLFAMRRGPGPALVDARAVALPAGAPHDVEALVAVDKAVLVIGSRGALMLVRPDATGLLGAVRRVDVSTGWAAAVASAPECLRALFVDPPPALANEACRAIVAAERRGEPFTIEGAAGVAEAGGVRVWIGLRAPQLDEAALLLRLVPGLGALRFDGVALVDLGGRGIHELAAARGRLWGIAGPKGATETSRLWYAPLSDLAPGRRLVPDFVESPLPDRSEAFEFEGAFAIVLVDGERGPKGAACRAPAGQVAVALSVD